MTLERVVARAIEHAVLGGELGRDAQRAGRQGLLVGDDPRHLDQRRDRRHPHAVADAAGHLAYGDSLRERCQELFDDGILSAIDSFTTKSTEPEGPDATDVPRS